MWFPVFFALTPVIWCACLFGNGLVLFDQDPFRNILSTCGFPTDVF